jgi:hypothetical protein
MDIYNLDYFRNGDQNVYLENMQNLCAPIGLIVIHKNIDFQNNIFKDNDKVINDEKYDAMFDSISLSTKKTPKLKKKNITKKKR